MALSQELKGIISGQVIDQPDKLAPYSRDASIFEVTPQAVVIPENVEDIKKLVEYASDHPGVSLTARSGGTDMTGGPLSQSIVLDFKKFNKVIKIEGREATVQPGVYYRDFEKETLKHNLIMPSYPASREICMIGGMVANNSGGEKTLTYGQTKNYLKHLKVVLADGNEHVIKPLTQIELEQEMTDDSFSGKIYKELWQLVKDNWKLIQDHKPKVSKNSSGYFLWDLWDGQIFDLPKLFAGSQGTLGIITEATLGLVQPKKYSKLFVIFLNDLEKLGEITETVLQCKPESFESYDDKTLKLALRFLPDFVKILGAKNVLSLGWQFLPEFGMVLRGGLPKLVLMAEFTGDNYDEIDMQIGCAQQGIAKYNLKTRVTKDEKEVQKYWTIRRESFNLLRHHVHNKQTVPFIDDLVVQPEYLPEFLPKLEKILEPYHLDYSVAGHVGNGNFHIIPLMKLGDPKTKEIIPEVLKKVYDLILEFHGSITAEHNDGLIRSPYLQKMYGPEMYALFERVKKIFDPSNIFNPGKKVGSSWQFALEHIKKS